VLEGVWGIEEIVEGFFGRANTRLTRGKKLPLVNVLVAAQIFELS
jgi:hypothetical protein